MPLEKPDAQDDSSEMEVKIRELTARRNELKRRIDELTEILFISEDFGAGITPIMNEKGKELEATEGNLRTTLDQLRQINPNNSFFKTEKPI